MWRSTSPLTAISGRGTGLSTTIHRFLTARLVSIGEKLLLLLEIATNCSKQRVVMLLVLLSVLLSLQHHQAAYIIVVKHQLIGTIRK